MALYTPKQFLLDDETAIKKLIAAYPFAMLVSVVDGHPTITHVPMVFDAQGRLLGHVAQANPHARLLNDGARTTAVFSGPHGYVSPTWYAQPSVPTWNYATVHINASVRVLSVENEKLAAMDCLIRTFDDPARAGTTRHMNVVEQKLLLSAIHVFVLQIESVEAKFKLSQNKTVEDRHSIIAALRKQGHAGDMALADLMQTTLNSTHQDHT